jgi:peptide chain release factor subunit 1
MCIFSVEFTEYAFTTRVSFSFSPRSNGTSVISLIVPPKEQIARITGMLTEEYGKASNIKSRVNRLSVLSAITSVQQRLKLFNRVPDNGLLLFCGEVLNSDGKVKKLSIDVEPFKPINTSLYMCDNHFHTNALKELLEDDEKYGFIIMDGAGCLFGTLAGNARVVVKKISVDLPKKHGRGGQSAPRFARIRKEKRQNYVTQVAELATQIFITNDKANVAGLVLAGSADFKAKLAEANTFDPRLSAKVISIVDISYGGENGFSQAIDMAGESLRDVKFMREKKLLSDFFSEISRDTGLYCFGWKDTLNALEASAVDTIIVWETLGTMRCELRNKETGETVLKFLEEAEMEDSSFLKTADDVPLDLIDSEPLVEWLSNNYKSFGAKIAFVSDKSQEGSQFCKGFGGLGGIMRYKLDLATLETDDFDGNFDDDGFI